MKTASAGSVASDFYLTLLEKFPALIWRSGPDAKCDYFNQTWLDFTGRSLAQEKGDGWTQGVHPEDLADCLRNFRKAFQARRPFVLEYRLRRHDGEYRWIVDHGRAFHNLAGQFAGYLGACFDVTERRIAEESRREIEGKFHQLADNIADTFWITSPDLKTMHYVSAGYELTWGRTAESLYAHPHQWVEAIVPAERPRVFASFQTLKGDTAKVSVEYQIARPDGTLRWVHDRGFQVRDEAGRLVRLAGIASDITDRKRTEESLNLFRTLSDQSNDGFEVIDPKTGRFLDINGTTCQQLGYRREELLSMSVPDIEAKAVSVGTWRKVVEKIRRSGFQIVEGQHRRKDGSTFPVEVSVRYVKLDRDYLIAAVRDISERQNAAEALKHSHAQLRALTARVQTVREHESERISREIHDELGQTLTGLNLDLSWMQHMLEEGSGGRIRWQLLRRMRAMAASLETTVHAVQRISTELRPRMLDDLGLPATLEWQAEEFALRTGIRCRWKPRPTVAPSHRDQATALFRIFQEILTNVVRHAHARLVTLKLVLNDGELLLEVADDGKGFSEKKLLHHRSLGLLGMRERAALIGGRVEILSAPGKGTKVTVTSPFQAAAKRKKIKTGDAADRKNKNSRRR